MYQKNYFYKATSFVHISYVHQFLALLAYYTICCAILGLSIMLINQSENNYFQNMFVKDLYGIILLSSIPATLVLLPKPICKTKYCMNLIYKTYLIFGTIIFLLASFNVVFLNKHYVIGDFDGFTESIKHIKFIDITFIKILIFGLICYATIMLNNYIANKLIANTINTSFIKNKNISYSIQIMFFALNIFLIILSALNLF